MAKQQGDRFRVADSLPARWLALFRPRGKGSRVLNEAWRKFGDRERNQSGTTIFLLEYCEVQATDSTPSTARLGDLERPALGGGVARSGLERVACTLTTMRIGEGHARAGPDVNRTSSSRRFCKEA